MSIGQARKSLWIETENIVEPEENGVGQARKSLWIETYFRLAGQQMHHGQARKSLWIETPPISPYGLFSNGSGS